MSQIDPYTCRTLGQLTQQRYGTSTSTRMQQRISLQIYFRLFTVTLTVVHTKITFVIDSRVKTAYSTSESTYLQTQLNTLHAHACCKCDVTTSHAMFVCKHLYSAPMRFQSLTKSHAVACQQQDCGFRGCSCCCQRSCLLNLAFCCLGLSPSSMFCFRLLSFLEISLLLLDCPVLPGSPAYA